MVKPAQQNGAGNWSDDGFDNFDMSLTIPGYKNRNWWNPYGEKTPYSEGWYENDNAGGISLPKDVNIDLGADAAAGGAAAGNGGGIGFWGKAGQKLRRVGESIRDDGVGATFGKIVGRGADVVRDIAVDAKRAAQNIWRGTKAGWSGETPNYLPPVDIGVPGHPGEEPSRNNPAPAPANAPAQEQKTAAPAGEPKGDEAKERAKQGGGISTPEEFAADLAARKKAWAEQEAQHPTSRFDGIRGRKDWFTAENIAKRKANEEAWRNGTMFSERRFGRKAGIVGTQSANPTLDAKERMARNQNAAAVRIEQARALAAMARGNGGGIAKPTAAQPEGGAGNPNWEHIARFGRNGEGSAGYRPVGAVRDNVTGTWYTTDGNGNYTEVPLKDQEKFNTRSHNMELADRSILNQFGGDKNKSRDAIEGVKAGTHKFVRAGEHGPIIVVPASTTEDHKTRPGHKSTTIGRTLSERFNLSPDTKLVDLGDDDVLLGDLLGYYSLG